MTEPELTADQIIEAMRLAAGPLGQAINKFPCRFMNALIIGNPRVPAGGVNTATATLVDLGAGRLALTCWHVIEKFRERKANDPGVLLQIGAISFDPTPRLRPTSPGADIVAIDLSNLDHDRITNNEEIGGYYFEPSSWPPRPVQEGVWVTAAGFPAQLRDPIDPLTYSFGTLSIGTSRVTSAHEDHFAIQLERQFWVTAYKYENRADEEFRAFEGMSGGPVFIERRTEAGLSYFDLVGIVYEYQPALDLLLVVPSDLIGPDGTVRTA